MNENEQLERLAERLDEYMAVNKFAARDAYVFTEGWLSRKPVTNSDGFLKVMAAALKVKKGTH